MARRRKTGLCPCGSRLPYQKCCARFVDGDELPEAPAELMRSRYAAYAHGDVDYIIETTDREGTAWQKDLDGWRESCREFGRSQDFGGVEILDQTRNGELATVTFRANLSRRGADLGFVEESHFVRRDGRWYYSWGRFPAL